MYFHHRGSYNDHSSQGRHDMLGWKIRQRKLPIYQIHQIFASFFSSELNQSCTYTAKSVRVKEIKIKLFSFSSIKCEKSIAGGTSLHSFLVQPYLKDLSFFGWFNQARIEELLSCKILCRVLYRVWCFLCSFPKMITVLQIISRYTSKYWSMRKKGRLTKLLSYDIPMVVNDTQELD